MTNEMKYLQYAKHLPLILCADLEGVGIWIDGSFAIHADMRGHVGLYTRLGKGSLMSSANRMKHNTSSLIDTEIVDVGEKLPKCIFCFIISTKHTLDMEMRIFCIKRTRAGSYLRIMMFIWSERVVNIFIFGII